MSTQGDYLTGIADAIRAKEGSSDPIPANTFAERIAQITTGYDTSDATAQASHILSPYTAYGASGKITGTIPLQAGKTITPGTTQQTAVASGNYASGDILVAGDPNLKAENIAEGVSIFGVQGAHSGQEFATCTVTNQSDSALVNLYYINGDKSSLISIYPGSYNKKVIVNKYSFFIVTSFISPDVSGSVEDVSINLEDGKILFVTGNFELVIG